MSNARRLWIRIGVVYVAGSFALVGIWATFFPRSFYDDFPGGGRHWVSLDGPYNQHLVRDVGELSLALLVVVVAAAVTCSLPLVRAAMGATLLNGVLHVVYHARHLHPFGTSDRIAVMGSLAVAPLVALAVLVATRAGGGTAEGVGERVASG
jgi:hypothetical protein